MKSLGLIIMMMAGLAITKIGAISRDQETAVHISGIRSSKGNILINIFRSTEEYEQQQPFKTLTFDKTNLQNGELNLRVKVAKGVYGFTMIDDENGNGKLDKNMIGMPKEGFGFSNFYMEKLKKPAFDQFKIDLSQAQGFTIRVKYM